MRGALLATPSRSRRLYIAFGSRRSVRVFDACASSVSMRITSPAAVFAPLAERPARRIMFST